MGKYRNFIFQMIIVLFIFLVTAQTILTKGGMFFARRISGEDKAKSVGALWPYGFTREYEVVVTIIRGPINGEVRIILNGEKIIPLKGEEVDLSFQTGDLLWLDARDCPEPIWLRITASNPKNEPFIAGKEFTAWRELIFLGEVYEAGRL